MFRLNFETDMEKRSGEKGEILKFILMALAAVLSAVVICEFMIKPCWHVLKGNM